MHLEDVGLPAPHQTMTGRVFKLAMKTPIVYAWKRGNLYLYIGQSRVGFGRLISHHHVIGITDEVLDTDEFTMWYKTKEGLNAFEELLIKKLRPKYNKFIPNEVKIKTKIKRCNLCKWSFEIQALYGSPYDKLDYCKSCQTRIDKQIKGSILV